MKMTGKRVLSMLLTLIMVLGLFPAGVLTLPQAEAAETAQETIVIDFEGLAEELAEQDWWTGEYLGNRTKDAEITDAQKAQYDALLEYLAENKNWTINETQSRFNQTSYWNKRLIIDANDEYPWATCLYTVYMNVLSGVGQDGFQLDLNVSAEQAGTYRLDLEAFCESVNASKVVSDMHAGSGQIMIQVNGETALDNTLTTGSDELDTFKGNVIELTEGVNTIVIRCTGDLWGNNQAARRNLYVNKLSFVPADGTEEPDEPETPVAADLRVDFEELASELSEQEWWTGEYIGNRTTNAVITDAQMAQYDALLEYLAENKNWTINETQSRFNQTSYWNKRLIIDAKDEYPWATCLYTVYMNVLSGVGQDGFQVDLNVPADKAGEYTFNLEAFAENIAATKVVSDMHAGSGQIMIQVNGETALDHTLTTGDNEMKTFTGKVVELKEGVNTIVIRCTGDIGGGNQGGRRNLYVNSMYFTEPGDQPEPDTPDVPEIPELANQTDGSIEVDFKALGEEVAQQDWWQGLDFGSNAVKNMTAEQTAQYDNLLAYLANNKYWTINEDGTGFKKPNGYGKWLILNDGDGYDWGAALYAIYVGSDTGNALQIDINVSEEDAGTYWMSLDMFLDDLKSTQSPTGMYPGAGYVKVDVNGQAVIAHRPATGGNVVATLPGGFVELKAGVNEVRIHNSADFWNSGNAARRTIYLNKLRFDKAEQAEGPVESLRMDFKAFATKVSTRDWWEGFGYVAEGLRYFGCEAATDVHGSRGTSYGLMQDFMQENEFWSIDEDLSKFGTNAALKRIYIDNSDSPAGLRFYPNFFAGQNEDEPSYSQLVFSVRVPKGAAGEYEMDLEALHESAQFDPNTLGKLSLGGGYGDIYVNGKLVKEDYYFGSSTGETYTSVDTLGVVTLREGNNTVTIDMTGDYDGGTSSARRAISLCAIEFRGVDAVPTEDTMELFTVEELTLRVPKQVTVPVYAFRNGWKQEDLTNAQITVTAEDASLANVSFIAGEGLKIEALEAGKTTVTVTAELDGMTVSSEIALEVKEAAVLKSFDFSVKNIERRVARYTVQDLALDMIGVDGEAILPADAEIVYEVSDEELLQIDETNHTIKTLKNGDVTITASASVGGVTLSDTVELTIADSGDNMFGNNGDFENGVGVNNWIVYGPNSGMFNFTEAVDDGTGNTVMRITLNPNVSCREGFSSTEIIFRNGNFAEIQPGHMYEISVRTKNQGMKKAPGSRAGFQYVLQFYDYPINGRADSGILGEVMEQLAISSNDRDDWETIKFLVQAPITFDGPVYVMPRIVIRPLSEQDYDLPGWEGTMWYDDFSIREVGFESVELSLKDPLTSTVEPTTMYIKPVTTTGGYVEIDEAYVPEMVTASVTNEDVAQILTSPVRTAAPGNKDFFPGATVGLVGLNEQAEFVGQVTLGGFTREGRLDISQTNMPNVLRDISYTLDDNKAVVLAYGASAQGVVSARTTQLDPIDEEQLRYDGSIYFASSDTSVAAVDQATGDVTAVGEGSAVITAYALLDGITAKSTVAVTVTDDTDLAAILLSAENNYVTAGNFLQLTASGTRASGGKAELSGIALSYCVDEQGIATVSNTGLLTAHQPGTVTVTVSVSVMGETLSDSITLEVVDPAELPQNDLMLDFTFGSLSNVQNLTLEEHGVAINRQKSYAKGSNMTIPQSYGFAHNVPAGESMALDFVVRRSGWYAVEITGALYNNGNISDVFVDDAYVGTIDFHNGKNGAPYSAMLKGNTVWLEAGTHTVQLTAVTSGVQYLGRVILRATTDPAPIALTLMPDKNELLVGETTAITVSAMDANGRVFHLKAVDQQPAYTNYYLLLSTNERVLKTGVGAATGLAVGGSSVIMSCQINGETADQFAPITVSGGKIANAALTAEHTTLKPGAEPFALTLSAYDVSGGLVDSGYTVSYQSADTSIASVSQDGIVTITGKTGSVMMTAVVTEGSRELEATLWITVTKGKTEPTVYTYEERAIAQENVQKYAWAWQQKEEVVSYADFIVENLDLFYNMLIRESLPRSSISTFKTDPDVKYCHYCKTDLQAIYSHYPWIVDPINNPWKITCPICMRDFPSNDFGAYYESGLDERGYFSEARADKSLLVNELYPEMGEGWGVDDGFGYKTGGYTDTGVEKVHTYIALYVFNLFYDFSDMQDHDIGSALNALREAYLYTGDEKYGSAGAILTDRMADIYPEYDGSQYSSYYTFGDGGNYQGKLMGNIWEASYAGLYLTRAVDAFWPAMDNPDVVEYLRGKAVLKGIDPEQITPEYLRKNAEDNILREVADACITYKNAGNFGMTQACMATAAVALDTMPETEEYLDWAMRYGEVTTVNGKYHVTGGNALYNIIDLVDRNGFGNECSVLYNSLWLNYLADFADALDGYTGVEDVDMWKNAKFVDMYRSFTRTIIGNRTIALGEGGSVQGSSAWWSKDRMLTAFIKTGDPILAQGVYMANGNSADGLHADIFTKDPEAVSNSIRAIIREHGELDIGISEMLTGNGVAIHREGPSKFLGKDINGNKFSAVWMYFGHTDHAHAQLDALNIDIDAYGLPLSSQMGYPLSVSTSSAERMQWIRNTVSHNTVVVDDKGQSTMKYGAFPLHFDDAGKVKIMDAEAPAAYTQTDIYRRTLVNVLSPNGQMYTVDFFRILGGSEHVYSFHAATRKEPAVEGLSMVSQPMGTYAGADIPFGPYYFQNTTDPSYNQSGGYSWLDGVSRDSDPEATFSMDFTIEDFHHTMSDFSGVHLKVTMLSEEPVNEVALANGHPSQNGTNPEYLKYMLVRRSGNVGLDSLFTTVIEPYQYEQQVVASELVQVELISGTELATDRVAAIKNTLIDGRTDYVVYASNPDCLYEIDGRFSFSGFIGVCSYYGNDMVYAYGNEATQVGDIESTLPAITGTITDFTEGLSLEGYTMTVQLDQSVTEEDFEGRYVYVNNDGERNGAYRIHGVQLNGNTAVLDLAHQTLVRSFLDGNNMDLGYVHNIAVGQSFTIPLSVAFDASSYFAYTTDQVVRAGNKLSLTTGTGVVGVTYEAEGMPKGMKITAANGQLTWATSKTQTGRYPITVNAVRDGEVVGTMSFVVYVVSYSGSSYAADVCVHSKIVTYTLDNADGTITVETVCPACGTVTKTMEEAEQVEKFTVAGSNMTLGNELAVNFLIKASDYADGQYAVITHNGQTAEVALVKYNNAYYAAVCKVAAKELADTLSVVIMNAEGEAVSEVYEGSAKTYAMKLLANSGTNAKLKTLVVDMLNYGTEAQNFFSYNTQNLANSELTEEHRKLATDAVTCVNRQVKGLNFVGSNLSLEDKIILNMMFKGAATDGMYAEITYTDYQGIDKTVTMEKSDFGTYGPYIKIVVDEIVLADAFELVAVSLYNADHSVYGTGADSVESYAKRTGDLLAAAMMKFASSAKAYLS